MANVKLSELTSAANVADANEFEINEAGTSKKVTGTQIKSYVNAGDGALAAKDTVATADIDADAVDGTKIADDSIDSEHYVDGSIDTAHIADDQITAAKIADNAVGADALNVSGNGTSGQALTSDGDGTFTWADAGGGGLTGDQLFTNSGTWNKPSGVKTVYVTVVGGGGGGGGRGHYNSGSTGTGGNAGGIAYEVVNVENVNSVAVTVGNGGNGGGNNFANGGTGGTSSFGSFCSATGGTGGYGGQDNNAALNRLGGIGSGGRWNIRGEQGHFVQMGSGFNGNIYDGAGGADGLYGMGGHRSSLNNNTGWRNAQGYGAGGVGGTGIINTNGVNVARAGSKGAVYVRY
jgi:hypothetical protein